MIILDWKLVSNDIKLSLKNNFSKYYNKYVAIFLLHDHTPSKVYVNLKKKFANDVWLDFFIFWWVEKTSLPEHFAYLQEHIDKDCNNIENLLSVIDFLNTDTNCLWEVVQLPLPDALSQYKSKILSRITPRKDLDGLWWLLFGLSSIDYIDFIPATPNAVIKLLDYYNLWDYNGKSVAILWQSNLVWKPLAIEIIKRGGEVFSFNENADENLMKDICKRSDYIISATWKVHLVDESFLNPNWKQVLIDIWWWIKDWKAVWDINYDSVKDRISAITPVPWGIWPVTVASLFDNIRVLENIYNMWFLN